MPSREDTNRTSFCFILECVHVSCCWCTLGGHTRWAFGIASSGAFFAACSQFSPAKVTIILGGRESFVDLHWNNHDVIESSLCRNVCSLQDKCVCASVSVKFSFSRACKPHYCKFIGYQRLSAKVKQSNGFRDNDRTEFLQNATEPHKARCPNVHNLEVYIFNFWSNTN